MRRETRRLCAKEDVMVDELSVLIVEAKRIGYQRAALELLRWLSMQPNDLTAHQVRQKCDELYARGGLA